MPRHNCLKKKEVATSIASEATTACSRCARQVVLRCGNPNFKLFDTLLPPT